MTWLEVINGLGLHKQLLRSYHLKRSRKGRRFPPRTIDMCFEEGVLENPYWRRFRSDL